MSDIYFRSMLKVIEKLCPSCTKGEVKHVANLIGNKLRSLKYDIYGVEIQTDRSKLAPQQYCTDESVRWKHLCFHIRVIVD